MKCKHCKGVELRHTQLEEQLVAAQCPVCEGVLIPLMNYRYWQEFGEHKPEPIQITTKVDDFDKATLCPSCNGLMLKFRVGIDAPNRVDFCSACDDVWLDKGEWDLLKCTGVEMHLTEIVSEGWQKDLRLQEQKRRQEKYYTDLIGEGDFAKLEEFKLWLDQHSEHEQIMRYLMVREEV